MKPHITLTAINGRFAGKQFVLSEPGTYLVGRSEDCEVPIPNEFQYRTVSRHHCLLQVNPPEIGVRDLGSRNGTFVNGMRIGRNLGHEPEDHEERPATGGCELRNGDELRVADISFWVTVFEEHPFMERVPGDAPKMAAQSGSKPSMN
jgi:pSer/pThr/pTyr-binding forkhead associated (FHA) protein